MPMEMPRKYSENGPHNLDVRARERQEERERERGLFGRQGMLREIANMQQMPMPVEKRLNLNGGPSNSDLRAAERKAAKDARVQALLEERSMHEQAMASIAPRPLGRGSSVPVLPSMLGLSASPGAQAPQMPPEEMERQKLRVACKMETLAFLNGYHSAVGKMSNEQKADLLSKLQPAQPAPAPARPKPDPDRFFVSERNQAPAHAPRSPPNVPCAAKPAPGKFEIESEDFHEDVKWNWPDHQEEERQGQPTSTIQERLQHVNDMCNEAFDFEL